MEKSSLAMLMSAFLAIIVGVSLIGVIASEGNDVTNTINVTGESVDYTDAILDITGEINTTKEITIANAPDGWRITDCPVVGFDLYNDSGSLTLTADYTFTASTGVILFNNTANVNDSLTNTTTATYVYCDEGYLTQGWNRTIIDLIPGFFALALMGIGVGLFYGVMRKEGLINA